MNVLTPEPEGQPVFNIELFSGGGEFDMNAAFQDAMQGVATDAELTLDEKVQRMEVIVSEGTSDVYRDFVDFQQMAAQMEMFCNHDEVLGQAARESDTLFGFMSSYASDALHDHDHHDHNEEKVSKKDEEIDPRTGKKKKKKRGWLGFSFDV
jgi:hypothetical protein